MLGILTHSHDVTAFFAVCNRADTLSKFVHEDNLIIAEHFCIENIRVSLFKGVTQVSQPEL